jgi:hypothetical protein
LLGYFWELTVLERVRGRESLKESTTYAADFGEIVIFAALFLFIFDTFY